MRRRTKHIIDFTETSEELAAKLKPNQFATIRKPKDNPWTMIKKFEKTVQQDEGFKHAKRKEKGFESAVKKRIRKEKTADNENRTDKLSKQFDWQFQKPFIYMDENGNEHSIRLPKPITHQRKKSPDKNKVLNNGKGPTPETMMTPLRRELEIAQKTGQEHPIFQKKPSRTAESSFRKSGRQGSIFEALGIQ